LLDDVDRLRRNPRPSPDPDRQARMDWSRSGLERLLDHIAGLEGDVKFSSIPAAKYWQAFVLTLCYSGLTIPEVLSLFNSAVTDRGLSLKRNHGARFECALPPFVVNCLRSLNPGHPQVFGPMSSIRMRAAWFDTIARSVGLVGGATMLTRCATAASRLPVAKGGAA
jgi:hypothetical protein